MKFEMLRLIKLERGVSKYSFMQRFSKEYNKPLKDVHGSLTILKQLGYIEELLGPYRNELFITCTLKGYNLVEELQ